jgi:hypothetical protein
VTQIVVVDCRVKTILQLTHFGPQPLTFTLGQLFAIAEYEKQTGLFPLDIATRAAADVVAVLASEAQTAAPSHLWHLPISKSSTGDPRAE